MSKVLNTVLAAQVLCYPENITTIALSKSDGSNYWMKYPWGQITHETILM